MLTSLKIDGFRKFNHLNLRDLGQINIIVGANNTGKTTLLEAVMVFACGLSFPPMQSFITLHRDSSGMIFIQGGKDFLRMAERTLNVFHQKKVAEDLRFSLQGKLDDKNYTYHHSLKPSSIFSEFFSKEFGGTSFAVPMSLEDAISESNQTDPGNGAMGLTRGIPTQFLGYWKIEEESDESSKQESIPLLFPSAVQEAVIKRMPPLRNCTMMDILSHCDERASRMVYAVLRRENLEKEFLKEMNLSFSMHVESLENIPFSNGEQGTISFRMQNGEISPLYTWGDGVRRWFYLLGNMLLYPDSILCIEEVDVAFHHAAQHALALALCKYARKYRNQLFMTTHSQEFVETFLHAMNEDNPSFAQEHVRIITLREAGSDSDDFSYRVLDGQEALWALQHGLELRV